MSVPDAEQLAALADVLHTTVGELLGATLEHEESRDRLAEELARINAQLAIRNHRARRVLKAIAVVLLVFAALIFLTMLLFMAVELDAGIQDAKRICCATGSTKGAISSCL